VIISLHIPKSAGTSFKLSLKEHFGDALLEDYGTRPMRVPFERGRKRAEKFNKRIQFDNYKNVHCIHGHFIAAKYASFRGNALFITWLRDPIERLYSNYFHIMRISESARNTIPRKVRKEKWTLEEYCFHPLMKNFCSNFFWGFDISNFDFVGIVERFESEMEYFSSTFLDTTSNLFRVNANPDLEEYLIDPGLRADLEKFHSIDMEMYHRALEASLSRR